MMKLQYLKVFNSVKCGAGEYMFLQYPDFDMELIESLVYIKHITTGAEVITPLTNTPWFTVLKQAEQETSDEQGESDKNTPRVKQKKVK